MSAHQDQINRKAKSRLSEWQIGGIVNCHRAGVKENVICKTMNLSPSTVSTVINRAGSKGTGLLPKRSGAPLKMDSRDQRRLARQLRSAPLLPMKNHLKLWCDTNPSISMDTFRKYMKLIGFQSYKTSHKPALTPEHKLKRLSWCLDKVGWGPEQWRKVVWSDESKFMVLGNDGGSRVIRKEGERYNDHHIIRTKKFGSGSVMLLGCFWAGGYGPLVALDARVNQNKYIECLDKSYLPWKVDVMKNEEGNFVLQEDGASCHTGGISTSWKEGQPLVNSFSFWPAQSPDLNPIEHLWAIMEKRIESKRHRIDNAEQLLACIHEEWKNLGLDLAERLVASMPSRCQAVIDARGGITRY